MRNIIVIITFILGFSLICTEGMGQDMQKYSMHFIRNSSNIITLESTDGSYKIFKHRNVFRLFIKDSIIYQYDYDKKLRDANWIVLFRERKNDITYLNETYHLSRQSDIYSLFNSGDDLICSFQLSPAKDFIFLINKELCPLPLSSYVALNFINNKLDEKFDKDGLILDDPILLFSLISLW